MGPHHDCIFYSPGDRSIHLPSNKEESMTFQDLVLLLVGIGTSVLIFAGLLAWALVYGGETLERYKQNRSNTNKGEN